jgi:hypothetical protein
VARKRIGRKRGRGRPRKENPKRRFTTRYGRKNGHDLVDHGTIQLRTRKLRVTRRIDLELTPLGALTGNGLLDVDEQIALRLVETWLLRARRARSLRANASSQGLWEALLSGQGLVRGWPDFGRDPARRTLGDAAWWRLTQLHDHFARYRAGARFALVCRVAGGEAGPADPAELAALKAGLAMVGEYLRTSRPRSASYQRASPG